MKAKRISDNEIIEGPEAWMLCMPDVGLATPADKECETKVVSVLENRITRVESAAARRGSPGAGVGGSAPVDGEGHDGQGDADDFDDGPDDAGDDEPEADKPGGDGIPNRAGAD